MDALTARLNAFKAHLADRRLAPDHHIPFYLKWVSDFVAFCGGPQAATGEKIADFAESLQANRHMEDWQVHQAKNAIALFLEQAARGAEPAETPPPGIGREERTGPGPATWEQGVEEMRRRLRLRHYSVRTEESYVGCVLRFQRYINRPAPAGLGSTEVKDYLTHLAIRRHVAASTQNQAFNALVFFFREVLRQDIEGLGDTVRARQGRRLPVVLSRDEVRRLLESMGGTCRLMAQIAYGSGLRLMECIRLRVQDIDFDQRRVLVRSGKGDNDRSSILPESLVAPLRAHVEEVRRMHEKDLAAGYGQARLPDAIDRKYPNAEKDWRWQYVFPSATLSADTQDGKIRRFHTAESTLQRAVAAAARKAGLAKRVGVHTLRHSFATHLLEEGVNIRVIQELLGHKNVETTMIYTHVARQNMWTVRSPLDGMPRAGTEDNLAASTSGRP